MWRPSKKAGEEYHPRRQLMVAGEKVWGMFLKWPEYLGLKRELRKDDIDFSDPGRTTLLSTRCGCLGGWTRGCNMRLMCTCFQLVFPSSERRLFFLVHSRAIGVSFTTYVVLISFPPSVRLKHSLLVSSSGAKGVAVCLPNSHTAGTLPQILGFLDGCSACQL